MQPRFWLFPLLILALPALAHETPPTYNRVTLSESASSEVANDLMTATLLSQHQGRQAARLADQVNREISAAIRLAQSTSGIEVRTQTYRTQPVYEKQRIKGWRVSQSIRLESRDSKVLGELLGRLQDSLKLQSVDYRVSSEQRRQHVDEVIQTALERFSRRAQLIASSFGRSRWRLVRLSVNDGGSGPVPVLEMKMMADAPMARTAAPVPLEAGTARIQVRVSGEIELSD